MIIDGGIIMDKYVETLHYIAAENGENYEVF